MDIKRIALAFAAGFAAVLVFHQGMAIILYLLGGLPAFPYSFAPRPPFGVPAVISSSFFGGLWGIALVFLLDAKPEWPAIPVGIIFGAVALTFVALTVVALFRGQPIGALDPFRWWRGLLLNGTWGLGVVLIMRMLDRRQAAS